MGFQWEGMVTPTYQVTQYPAMGPLCIPYLPITHTYVFGYVPHSFPSIELFVKLSGTMNKHRSMINCTPERKYAERKGSSSAHQPGSSSAHQT